MAWIYGLVIFFITFFATWPPSNNAAIFAEVPLLQPGLSGAGSPGSSAVCASRRALWLGA